MHPYTYHLDEYDVDFPVWLDTEIVGRTRVVVIGVYGEKQGEAILYSPEKELLKTDQRSHIYMIAHAIMCAAETDDDFCSTVLADANERGAGLAQQLREPVA